MEIKTEVNSKINWQSGGRKIHSDTETVLSARMHYFNMLRRLLSDIEAVGNGAVNAILKKYNVHFVDVDDIKRVNIDEPK